MSDKGNREETLDPNFTETVELLNVHGIPYWACHGTLLGLVRDKRLIPWDHDIDIAVWSDSVSKTSIIELMTTHGYVLKSDGSDYDFLQFTKDGGREVDFNFYHATKDSDTAYSEWFVARSHLTSVLEELSSAESYRRRRGGFLRRLEFLRPVFALIVLFLKALGLFYRSAGYTTPKAFLKGFEFLEVDGVQVRVPEQRNNVLAYVYGDGWRTPKREYNWEEESPSTRVSNSRFS